MKTKVSNVNWVITENQLKHCFWKQITEADAKKKTKRLPEIQVLTKDVTSKKNQICL